MAWPDSGDERPSLQIILRRGAFFVSTVRDDTMKRWGSHLAIAAYLSVLVGGIVTHALQYKEHSHPLMYYVVWDMFCGWTCWEQRTHLIGEGESGQFYELGPGPWGDYHPFSNLSRQHYDPFCSHAFRIADNSLRHTTHEPMARIHVVEESWAKKHNLPPFLAKNLEPIPLPGQRNTYFHLRKSFSPDGSLIHDGSAWLDVQSHLSLMDNPSLKQKTGYQFPVLLTGGPPQPPVQ